MSGKPDQGVSLPSPPLSNLAQEIETPSDNVPHSRMMERWLPWFMGALALGVVFYHLGGAALFEPDEGRNAEKAREIILLGDWVTPHENFHPVLDKPIFFYWLIALSYKIFGVSEWAARLPSALAALGCVVAVYGFARFHWGKQQALWSSLILLTSLEFFLLARLVIFDMTLTFFLTLALGAFYLVIHCDDLNRRRLLCVIFYVSLGAATLIKGLIGVLLPGLVILGYLFLSRRWSVLRRFYLLPGALLFLAIVLPWYLEMGHRHGDYLRYYFWQEHFGRFAQDQFDRAEPWYYFIFVGVIGLFPWTLLLPFSVWGARRRAWDDKTLFLTLWAVLPFLFFSISKSKLPHYILPIFPPLALLIGARLVRLLDLSERRARCALSLVWAAYGLVVLYFLIGYWFPAVLPSAIVHGITNMPRLLWIYGAMLLTLAVLLTLSKLVRLNSANVFLSQALILGAFQIFTTHTMIAASSARSAKPLADAVRPLLKADSQIVIYDTYTAGLPFYLRSERPFWVVTRDKRESNFLGNYYVLGKAALPITRYGNALFNFDEFAEQWRSAGRPLLILTKSRNRAQLETQIGTATRTVASLGQYVWLTKP